MNVSVSHVRASASSKCMCPFLLCLLMFVVNQSRVHRVYHVLRTQRDVGKPVRIIAERVIRALLSLYPYLWPLVRVSPVHQLIAFLALLTPVVPSRVPQKFAFRHVHRQVDVSIPWAVDGGASRELVR